MFSVNRPLWWRTRISFTLSHIHIMAGLTFATGSGIAGYQSWCTHWLCVTFSDSEQTRSGVRKLISTESMELRTWHAKKKILCTLLRSKVIDNSVIFWLDESHSEVHRWYRLTNSWFILSSESKAALLLEQNRLRCSCITPGKDVKKYSTLETFQQLFIGLWTWRLCSWRFWLVVERIQNISGRAIVYLVLWLKMSELNVHVSQWLHLQLNYFSFCLLLKWSGQLFLFFSWPPRSRATAGLPPFVLFV